MPPTPPQRACYSSDVHVTLFFLILGERQCRNSGRRKFKHCAPHRRNRELVSTHQKCHVSNVSVHLNFELKIFQDRLPGT